MSKPSDSTGGYDRWTGAPFASRSETIAPHAMAATSQPLATQVALECMKRGGNAVDAAIAANAALGLMEPTGCGVGGDLFAIVWDNENQKLLGLNGSGRSPARLALGHLRELGLSEMPYLGPLSVSVPGAVDGWFELHDRLGSTSMADILAPAIQYARNGFPVSEVIAWQWAENSTSRSEFPGYADVYLPGGKPPAKGEIFRNPALAATYELLAEAGRAGFYEGEIATALDEYMSAHGGFLRYDDMTSHRSEWVEPLSPSYRGFELFELPPNGQGVVALQLLNILETFDLRRMGFGSAEYIHAFVEAKKLAYEDRARYYADMEFYEAPLEGMISKRYGKQRSELISMDHAASAFPAGEPRLEKGDTVYLTTADSEGNMVSLIQSNYGGMGSGMTLAEYGFQLQNRGALFSLRDGHANVYEARKRPFHTIIPAFVMKDEKPVMSFGVMGGSMQPQAHAQIMINMIDFDMNLQEAGDAARIRHSGSSQPTDQQMSDGGKVYLESGFGGDVREKLQALGHTLEKERQDVGGYQAISLDAAQGVYYGASEVRKDGQAAGY